MSLENYNKAKNIIRDGIFRMLKLYELNMATTSFLINCEIYRPNEEFNEKITKEGSLKLITEFMKTSCIIKHKVCQLNSCNSCNELELEYLAKYICKCVKRYSRRGSPDIMQDYDTWTDMLNSIEYIEDSN